MLEPRLFSDRDLWRLVIPLALEQMLFCLVGSVDTMMISSLGEASVSGVSLVDMMNNFLINIFAAIATGGAVVASQFLGAKNQKSARDSATQLIVTTCFIACVIMVLTELFKRQVIGFLFGSIDDDVMTVSMAYCRVTALSFPLIAVNCCCAALMRSMNKTNLTLMSSAMSNVVNVIGNYLLIYVFHYGVTGAAVATLFARFSAMVFLLYLLTNRQSPIYITRHGWLTPNGRLIHKILYIGIPSGIENGVFQFGRLIVVGVIAKFGTSQMTANAVANNLDYFGCMVGSAFCLACITVIGQSVGTGSEEQVRFYVRKIMKMAYISHMTWNVLLFIVTPFWLNYYHMSPETRQMAFWLVMIHNGCGFFLWPLAFVFPNVLRSANDVKFTMVASIASMFIWRIGFSHVLGIGLGWGAYGVWTAMVVDWLCRITCFTVRYKRGKWVKLAHLTA